MPVHSPADVTSVTVLHVATPTAPTIDALTRTSDSLQAAYFRGALADHRALIAAEIGRQSRKLGALSIRSDALEISRLRSDIRVNENECRALDRMIAAIDRRFPTLWATQD